MEQIRKWIRENDWKSMGIIAYYGYFAVNVLVKAFGFYAREVLQIFTTLPDCVIAR